MAHDRPGPDRDRLLVARLDGIARRHARWGGLTEAEKAAGETELREVAGDHADLLAEVAGLALGTAAGRGQEYEARGQTVAELCRLAGADEDLRSRGGPRSAGSGPGWRAGLQRAAPYTAAPVNASIMWDPGRNPPGEGGRTRSAVMSSTLFTAAAVGGIMLVTGTAKWALARAWPGVFGKPQLRTGKHRGRPSRTTRR